MSISSLTGPFRFAFGGFANLYSWIRDRRPFPLYIHLLGAIGALTGFWMATLDGGRWQEQVLRAVLYAAIMMGLVYVSFGYYGAAVMEQRKNAKSQPGAG